MAVKAMHSRLEPHPNTPCQAISGIEVEIMRSNSGRLELIYRATGDVRGIRLPRRVEPERADDLWRRTCFEVFIKEPESWAYSEFNFAPSGCWAAYGFDDTRQGMRNLELAAPTVTTQVDAKTLVLTAALGLDHVGPLQLAISAVIEDVDGTLSYWALTHPGERPDFHHPGGFVLDLPEPEPT